MCITYYIGLAQATGAFERHLSLPGFLDALFVLKTLAISALPI